MFLVYISPNSCGFAAVAQDTGECDHLIFLQIVQSEFYKSLFQFVTEMWQCQNIFVIFLISCPNFDYA